MQANNLFLKLSKYVKANKILPKDIAGMMPIIIPDKPPLGKRRWNSALVSITQRGITVDNLTIVMQYDISGAVALMLSATPIAGPSSSYSQKEHKSMVQLRRRLSFIATEPDYSTDYHLAA